MNRTAWLIVAALTQSVVAHADEANARKLFDAGERAYNLGEFAEAAENFRKAFEEWPEPAFLFNLAQTYRQIGDCKQASFFYKRFLALKERDDKKPIKPALKAEVEKRIVELDECMKREMASKPPNELDGGGTGGAAGGGTGTTGTGTTGTGTTGTGTTGTGGTQTAMGGDGSGNVPEQDEPEDGEDDDTVAASGPSLVALRVGLGAGLFTAGSDISTMRFSAALLGGYPIPLGDKLRLDVGAGLMFMPVSYETSPAMGPAESGSANLIGLVANVGPTYEVANHFSIRGDVGVGVQLFTGLSKMGNPFTEGGATASGALSTLLVRVGVSADYAVTPNLVATVTPVAFSYSPAPDGFVSTISSITTISFLAGVSYHR